MNRFESRAWPAWCEPFDGCLDLKPADWTPVPLDPPDPDAGVESRKGAAEIAFCTPPQDRRYLFAFDERGASYDGFNIVTGDTECAGRSLAYIGIGGVGDEPLAPVRTHCISVEGKLLGSRLAVISNDPNAVFSNLRAVSACPCAYPIPYNVNTCPGVEGSAGHPNCG